VNRDVSNPRKECDGKSIIIPNCFYAVAKKCFKCIFLSPPCLRGYVELLSKFPQNLVFRSSVDAFKYRLQSDKNNGPLHVCQPLERGMLTITKQKIIQK
jgi:hypothetical protein